MSSDGENKLGGRKYKLTFDKINLYRENRTAAF